MDEKLIDIEELVDLFKRRFWIVIVIAIMTTGLAVLKVSKLQPSYVANSKIFIGRGTEMLQYYSEQELESYSKFLTIFTEISRVEGFLDEALKAKGINKSSVEVASRLNFSGSANTPLFNISYSSRENEDMEKILDGVCEELVKKVKQIMPETNPTVLSKAVVSTVYPNKKKLPTIAFAAGVILAIGLILVFDYLDDKVRHKKELEKLLPIPLIGEIPVHEKRFLKEDK